MQTFQLEIYFLVFKVFWSIIKTKMDNWIFLSFLSQNEVPCVSLALTQEMFEWLIWMCRQAGRDICHSADGQHGFGWSSWLSGVPHLPLVLLSELRETSYVVRSNKAFFLLFKEIYDISHGLSLLVSCYLFTSICITSLFVHNKSHCSNYHSHLELWTPSFPNFFTWQEFPNFLIIFNPRVGFCIRAHFSDGMFFAELPDS